MAPHFGQVQISSGMFSVPPVEQTCAVEPSNTFLIEDERRMEIVVESGYGVRIQRLRINLC